MRKISSETVEQRKARLARGRAYYVKTAEFVKMKYRREVELHGRAEMTATHMRRRALNDGFLHSEYDHAKAVSVYEMVNSLAKQTGERWAVDHIIPIKCGGWHHHDNLQPMPFSVNGEKGNNPLWEHPEFKSWRDIPQKLWPAQLRKPYLAILAFEEQFQ